MDNETSEIANVDINKEMREAYLQYSMSVIVGRALPSVMDGLKPVHRRVLYAMNDLGNAHNKPYKKSARIVGDVIGKYHPHGDMAVYDTIVRMAQDFSLRYPLVDGQGNFGSIDGDAPAASRYTEIRMTKLAEELLEDIDKETVPFGWNYDDSLLIPNVLPAKFPNLLVNGSSGIAVGMATNIPPHNMSEVIDGCVELIKNPELTIDELIKIIPGPDFPTAGIIKGTKGIISAYKTGRGIITMKAVSEIVPRKDREDIIVTEIPYQVNKAKLIESVANLVKEKKVEGISDIRDESSREGMRIVIQLKRGENAQVVLNRLHKFTQLQMSYGIIMLALDSKNQPVTFDLKSMLEAFIAHRKDVVTRRCIFDLKKAEARAHILEGLKKALDQIDAIIATIRASKESDIAKQALIDKFSFSIRQAQAILEMRLQRLTGLEREKIENELSEILKHIEWLKKVLASSDEIFKIIVEELENVKKLYGDARRTQIEASDDDEFIDEDLIAKEDVVVSLTFSGYIKRIPLDEYRLQKRGGKGLKGAGSREEDFVWKVFAANTHTTILNFSDRGKIYWLKSYQLPQGSRTSKGKAINNVIQLSNGENVRAVLPVEEFSENCFVVLLTEKGIIKKTPLSAFSRPRPSGLIALTIELDDNLSEAQVSNGSNDILIVTKQGMSIRFDESDVRSMGRGARGVKGITLGKDDAVVGMATLDKDSDGNLLIVTSNGYGKRTPVSEYRRQSRGGVGIITQKTSDKSGEVVSARMVLDSNHLLLSTNKGQSIRMKCSDISVIGRNTQGVRLMNLNEGEFITSVALIEDDDVDDTEGLDS
ncbi:MAG: DNA gyrase subunit A [Bdellovibrionaceae bacterium]|nr:DNA gyrase subunit A [Pseudobdellovibrionaceae bacterium]|tara:strand:- start:28277 stop:30739 length:2463 start_codon:yes stop_codon:yes gene_type:complete